MAEKPTPADEGWERGWEGHQRAQASRLARLPLWEKIAWLEEAHHLARALARPREGQAPGDPRP